MILVGDEPYYRRFGFGRAAARRLDYPPPTNPDRLLARALVPGAFDGVAGMVRRWEGARLPTARGAPAAGGEPRLAPDVGSGNAGGMKC